MSNFPTVPGFSGSLAEAVQQSKVQSTDTGGVAHIKYNAYGGDWKFGKDGEDITDETVTVITDTISHGWHLWCDREVTKRMVSFVTECPEPMPDREDRKGKMQSANGARGFECVLDDDGESIQLSWEHSTDGCRRAVDAMLTAIRARAATDPEYLYPVVKLTSDPPYENPYKDGEMLHPPKLEIVGWRNREGEDAPAANAQVEDQSEAAEEPTPKPKKRRQRRSAA